MEGTYRVREAIKSSLVKLKPALKCLKSPDWVLKETSVPRAKTLFPTTPEKLTMGLAVKPTLVQIPA